MHGARSGRELTRTIVAAFLCLAAALGGQTMFDASQGGRSQVDTSDVVGRAGFAYLTGLRTYAAAVLWNRIEPILHGYYSDASLGEQRYIAPTISAVVALDPNFIEAYYVGAWVVASNGQVEESLDLARQGVEANPLSGLLRVNYAQTLETWGEDLPAAHEQAVIAMGDDMEWRDGFEKHDSYAIIRAIMDLYGDEERAAQAMAEIERLDEELGDALPPGAHDHDGDGEPDH